MMLFNNIEFKQDQNIEHFIGQFQSTTDKIICLINKTRIHLYDYDDKNLPNKIKLADKDRSADFGTIYYFKDLESDDDYCIFGKKPAQRFLLAILNKNGAITKNPLMKIIGYDESIIIDTNINSTLKFKNFNQKFQIEKIVD